MSDKVYRSGREEGMALDMLPEIGRLWSRQPVKRRSRIQRDDQLGIGTSCGNSLTRTQSVFKAGTFLTIANIFIFVIYFNLSDENLVIFSCYSK